MSDRLTHILLIDDDPIFRLGLRTALAEFPHLQVVAEADTGATALQILGRRQNQEAVDLVVLELQLAELSLCQQLKT
ncbi:MAG: response regulator transcription factor, partial [Symploca sp. SIO2G7]|nr:response regulator transcription factor [Symploca sp. SIO2G7]